LPLVSVPSLESGVVERLRLEDALRRLTPKQRAVLVLRFYDDLTEAQTAEVLKVSRNTVKSQTRLALRRLRELTPGLVAPLSDLPEEVG
jgi:RNA polymerase sigma factor (sigma-70 family)